VEPLSTEAVRILPPDRIKKIERESKVYRGEKTMRLNLLFIVMDLLTLLAYPIVFVYGKNRRFSKSKEGFALAN